jgi:hypothetical protein
VQRGGDVGPALDGVEQIEAQLDEVGVGDRVTAAAHRLDRRSRDGHTELGLAHKKKAPSARG